MNVGDRQYVENSQQLKFFFIRFRKSYGRFKFQVYTQKKCVAYFMEQEEWSAEVVKRAGFNISFYPKYHCELNHIGDGQKAIIHVLVRTIIKISKVNFPQPF